MEKNMTVYTYSSLLLEGQRGDWKQYTLTISIILLSDLNLITHLTCDLGLFFNLSEPQFLHHMLMKILHRIIERMK